MVNTECRGYFFKNEEEARANGVSELREWHPDSLLIGSLTVGCKVEFELLELRTLATRL